MLSLWRLFGPLLIKYWISYLIKNKQQFFNISQHQWINIQNIKIDFITTFWKREKNLVANTPLVREINGISRSQHAYTNMRGGGKIKRERVILYAQGNMEPLPLAADSSAYDLTNRKNIYDRNTQLPKSFFAFVFLFFSRTCARFFCTVYMFDVTRCLYYSYWCLNASIYTVVVGHTICAACSLAVICETFDKHAVQSGVDVLFRFSLQFVQTV